MSERPILFRGDMVRALLSGQKTQTRRVVKDSPSWAESWGYTCFTPPGHISTRGYWKGVPGEEGPAEKFIRCPFGIPGDRLWVRETWAKAGEVGDHTEYRADNPDPSTARWRPSIHMPRWASRLSLTITDVRVQRLQDISEADAVAEGFADKMHFALKSSLGWDTNPWVWAITFKRVTP